MFNKLRGMFPVKVILTLSLLQYIVLYVLEKIGKDKRKGERYTVPLTTHYIDGWISETEILEEIYKRSDYSKIVSRKSIRLTIRSLIRRGLIIDDDYHHLSYRYPRNHYFLFLKLNTQLDPCVM